MQPTTTTTTIITFTTTRRYSKGKQFSAYLDQIRALTGPGKYQVVMLAGFLLKLLHM
jgi:hypothetical protein